MNLDIVKMLRCITLVTYFAGALGHFSSNYKCEDIGKALTEPVTLDEIAGTWYEVERVERPYRQLLTRCIDFTIENKKGADGKLIPQQKYVLNYEGNVKEGTVTQNATAVGRFITNDEYVPFWMVRTGEDFFNHALIISCEDKPLAATNLVHAEARSDVYITMLSRTKTLTDEEKNIVKDKLKSITDLASAKLKNICPPYASSSSDDDVEPDS